MVERLSQFCLVTACLLALAGGPALAQGQARLDPQQKLMAKRAAQLDAYRKLAERIMGLQLSSRTKVGEFVTESDEIATQMDHFIKGVRFKDTRYFSDGSVEVDAAVTIQQVVKEIKRIHDEVYDGERWEEDHFENIKKYTEQRVIEVTGAGAARTESQVPEPKDEPVVSGPERTRRTRQIDLPDIYSEYPPAERLKAKRAAELDAYRQLMERVYGLQVTSETHVEDFVTESDRIRGALEGSIKGARISNVRYAPDGVVEVEMKLTIQTLIKTVKKVHDEVYDGERWKEDHFEEIDKRTKRKVLTVLGTGALDTGGDESVDSGGRRSTTTEEVIIVE